MSLASLLFRSLFHLLLSVLITVVSMQTENWTEDTFSNHFIEDRAKFLYQLVNPEAVISNLDSDIDYTDTSLDVEIEADNGMIGIDMDRQYWWGTKDQELFKCSIVATIISTAWTATIH